MAQVEARGTHHGKPYTDSPLTVPSLTEVQGFIADRSNQIDARLAQVGVSTPVDPIVSPKAAALLAIVCSYGAAADAQNAAYFRFHAVGEGLPSARTYEARFKELLASYAGDGTPEGHAKGNPNLLQDAIFTSQKPVWPLGELAQISPDCVKDPPYIRNTFHWGETF